MVRKFCCPDEFITYIRCARFAIRGCMSCVRISETDFDEKLDRMLEELADMAEEVRIYMEKRRNGKI